VVSARSGHEIQVSVALPAYGSRGKICVSGLPKREVEQILASINTMPELSIADVDFSIFCRVPSERKYRAVMGCDRARVMEAISQGIIGNKKYK